MSKKKRNKGNNIQGSPLSSHKREGKLLSPPLASLNVQPSAWQNDRLPEMLWAALLVAQLDRDHALKIFRLVGNLIYELRTDVSLSEPPYLVTHSAIEKLPTDVQGKLLRTIVADSECKQALQPLMLLKELPAREAWGKSWGAILHPTHGRIYPSL